MLVSFNPAISNNRTKNKSQSFGNLKNGLIEAAEVAKSSFKAGECYHDIYLGAYKPTLENLKALVDAKKIANKNESKRLGILSELDDDIILLVQKAKEQGQEAYNSLKGFIKEAKEQKLIDQDL